MDNMTRSNASELKNLQSKLNDANKALDAANESVKAALKQAKEARETVASFEAMIKAIGTNELPIVTEHAFLRYCERVLGLDMDKISKTILSKDVLDCYQRLGDGKFPAKSASGKSFKVVIKNKKVVSVI